MEILKRPVGYWLKNGHGFCVCYPHTKNLLKSTIKYMSSQPSLCHVIPTRAIQTLFDEQNQPLFHTVLKPWY